VRTLEDFGARYGLTSHPLRFFGLAAGAVLVILGARYCAEHYVDFPVYWHGTQSLLSGRQDLYSQNFVWGSDSWMTYRYPPLFLLLFTPLGMLPYMTAGTIWFALKFAALTVTLRLLYKMLRVEGGKGRLFWLLPFLMTTPYLAEEFRYGNVHFFIVFLIRRFDEALPGETGARSPGAGRRSGTSYRDPTPDTGQSDAASDADL
jgi:hypothetical protein